jgi:hypothetical protein
VAIKKRKLEQMKENLDQSNSLVNEQRESANAHKATALTELFAMD